MPNTIYKRLFLAKKTIFTVKLTTWTRESFATPAFAKDPRVKFRLHEHAQSHLRILEIVIDAAELEPDHPRPGCTAGRGES